MADGNDEVGDRRKKHVSVDTRDGERIEHGDVYLRFSETEFAVSEDPSFPEEATTRYEKASVRRVEVTQHHSACFITTATAERADTLDALRGFRDDSLAASALGRGMIGLYEAVSPPIAHTLERHPRARTTRVVRWLIAHCASLARRRQATASGPARRSLTVALTAAYAAGIAVAVVGHTAIRARESLIDPLRTQSPLTDRDPSGGPNERRRDECRD